LRSSKRKNAAGAFNSTAGIVTSMSPRAPQADGAHDDDESSDHALDKLTEHPQDDGGHQVEAALAGDAGLADQ
jgi:hypothetical protein